MRPHPNHDVLVVDPADEVRDCLTLFLQLHGWRVVGTRGADDTLRALRNGFRPCVVLADPRTFGVDAWGLVDYLRADSVLTTVPLILMAADALQAKSAHWRGVRECVPKPAVPTSVVAAVERQCWRRRMYRAPADRARANVPMVTNPMPPVAIAMPPALVCPGQTTHVPATAVTHAEQYPRAGNLSL